MIIKCIGLDWISEMLSFTSKEKQRNLNPSLIMIQRQIYAEYVMMVMSRFVFFRNDKHLSMAHEPLNLNSIISNDEDSSNI